MQFRRDLGSRFERFTTSLARKLLSFVKNPLFVDLEHAVRQQDNET